MAAACTVLRLFIGGLPDGCTQAELEQRFAPFGKVTECDIAGPKTYGGGLAFPRGFGYISLLPKDDQALKSCLSTYNGCKWRGKVLRCQVAKQRYAERLQAEAQAAEAPPLAEGQEPAQAPEPLRAGVTLKLRKPKQLALFPVQVGSGQRVDAFPEQAPLPLPDLSWDPLPTPSNDRYQYEHLLLRVAAARAAAALEAGPQPPADAAAGSDGEDEGPGRKGDHGKAPAARAAGYGEAARAVAMVVASLGADDSRKAAVEAHQTSKTVKLKRKVVEFLDESDTHGRAPAGLDLARFDSDSDDGGGGPAPAAPPAKRTAAPARAAAPVRAAATAKLPAPAKTAAPAIAAAPAAAAAAAATEAVEEEGEEAAMEEDASAEQLSSGSSGQRELDDWLAEEEEVGGGQPEAGAGGSDGPSASGSDGDGGEEEDLLSSGGSELEEWLAGGGAAEESGADSPASSGGGGSSGAEEEGADGSDSPSRLESPARAAVPEPQAPAAPSAAAVELRQQAQQRAVVNLISEQEARLLERRRAAAKVDLSRFDSDSEAEGAAASGPGPQRTIPQLDGAGDSSGSESEGSDDEGSDAEESDSGSEELPANGSHPADGAQPAEQASSSDEDESEEESSGGEEEAEAEVEAGAEDEEDLAGGSRQPAERQHQAAEDAGPAEAEWLASLLPEGAGFKRSARPELDDAAWRVNKEAWTKDFRAKHRSAVRQTGRAPGKRAKRN